MKRFFLNSVKRANVKGIEVLTSEEMLMVRGGGIRPRTRDKDMIDEEKPKEKEEEEKKGSN